MKKKQLIILVIILIALVTATVTLVIFINNKGLSGERIDKENFKVSLEIKECNAEKKIIYTFEDGKKIYSSCGEIYIIGEKKDKIKLADAIDKKYISIANITSKMENVLALYDGGTIVYRAKNSTVSEDEFKIEVCKQNKGIKDIQFMSLNSNNYMCAK